MSNWSLCVITSEKKMNWNESTSETERQTEHLIISDDREQTEVHYYTFITEQEQKHMHDQLSAPSSN